MIGKQTGATGEMYRMHVPDVIVPVSGGSLQPLRFTTGAGMSENQSSQQGLFTASALNACSHAGGALVPVRVDTNTVRKNIKQIDFLGFVRQRRNRDFQFRAGAVCRK